MAKSKYLETFTSPAGVAVFPWLTQADTKHDKAGVFHTDLSVSPEDPAVIEFTTKLEAIRDKFADENLSIAQKQALVARPVSRPEYTYPDYPEDATPEQKAAIKAAFVPELTGNVIFRFKMKNNVTMASGKTFVQEPIVVAADTGAAIVDPVYSGSILRVRGQIVPYVNASAGNYGVTLRMKAVQVIDLVTGGGDGAAHWTDFPDDDEAAA